MIYFSSDTHWNHSKEFCYAARGFSSPEEMSEAIIERFNNVVAPEDELYLLGDIMLGDNEAGIECLKRLNGKIHIILGNHDTDTRIELYKTCPNVVSVEWGGRLRYKKVTYQLSHYPQLVANFDDPKPIVSIFGHTHQTEPMSQRVPKGFCVCVDANDCRPWSIEEIHLAVKNYEWLAPETGCACGGRCQCKEAN